MTLTKKKICTTIRTVTPKPAATRDDEQSRANETTTNDGCDN